MSDLYACAGYMLDENKSTDLKCDLCFIYDVTTPLFTVNPSNNKVSGMPDISKETGKIFY